MKRHMKTKTPKIDLNKSTIKLKRSRNEENSEDVDKVKSSVQKKNLKKRNMNSRRKQAVSLSLKVTRKTEFEENFYIII